MLYASAITNISMKFSGKIYKDGRFWLAEIPILDAMTQGHTRKEALEMAADMVETMANKEGFRVKCSWVLVANLKWAQQIRSL